MNIPNKYATLTSIKHWRRKAMSYADSFHPDETPRNPVSHPIASHYMTFRIKEVYSTLQKEIA